MAERGGFEPPRADNAIGSLTVRLFFYKRVRTKNKVRRVPTKSNRKLAFVPILAKYLGPNCQ
jgi:hypothetical protein